jgi:3-methyladenine DNA glycosylase/8-oxoguanine DNA glycosylase
VSSVAVAVPIPTDLRRTLRPLSLGWGRFLADGWWRAARTPDGPGTVHIRRRGDEVVATAWGPGAEWLVGRVPRWLGVDDDPAAFEPEHPVLADLHRRHPGIRLGRSGLVFEAALTAVLAQKVTGREAGSALRAITARFSDPAPGPDRGVRLPPDPDRMAALRYADLHPLGVEKRRADTLVRLARRARLLERLGAAPVEEVRSTLTAFPGVGAWTVAETVAVSHGHPDAVSVGDYHLKHLVAWHLAGEERGSDERMLELLEPYRPHRRRAVLLIELAGPYPRRGPRAPVRSFAAF